MAEDRRKQGRSEAERLGWNLVLGLLLATFGAYVAAVLAGASDAAEVSPGDRAWFGVLATLVVLGDIACVCLATYYRHAGEPTAATVWGVLPWPVSAAIPLAAHWLLGSAAVELVAPAAFVLFLATVAWLALTADALPSPRWPRGGTDATAEASPDATAEAARARSGRGQATRAEDGGAAPVIGSPGRGKDGGAT